MPFDWNTAIAYANLVAIAETVQPNASYTADVIQQITNQGYQFLVPIYGDDLATDLHPDIGDPVTFGFLAISPAKELVAAIRGTDDIWEWIDDANFLMVGCPVANGKGLTEDGFTAVYKSLRIAVTTASQSVKDAIKGYLDAGTASSVTVCGHSLGGALATLLVLDVAHNTSCKTPHSYTYASPRVGDHIFAHAYNTSVPATYRVVNRKDLVPQLPPPLPLPYEHVNTPEELNPKINTINPSLACMHHLTTYLWLMAQNVNEGSQYPLDADCLPE